MRSKTVRVALGAALLIVAVVLFLALRGGDEGDDQRASGTAAEPATPRDDGHSRQTPPPRPAPPLIVVRDGAPVGGPATIAVKAGEPVRFRVRSNVDEEIHVHGYDVTREVPAGGTVTVSFGADLEGIYEVELHGSGEQIAELRVEP